MRHIRAAFAMSGLAFFLSVPVIAGENHTLAAIEHAAKGKAHGDDRRPKELLEHAEESLRHAREAEKQHAEQRDHMAESVSQLEQAIEHGKAGKADVATKHVDKALVEMRRSTPGQNALK